MLTTLHLKSLSGPIFSSLKNPVHKSAFIHILSNPIHQHPIHQHSKRLLITLQTIDNKAVKS